MIEVTSPDKKVAALALGVIRARVNKDGLMGSKTRVHRTKKGKGSYSRKELRKKMIDTFSQL
jgi:stalled ribosome alternative rescue factor ArfA